MPSPLPSAPWQFAQYWSKVALPRAMIRGSVPSRVPWPAAIFSAPGPGAGVVADLAVEIGNPMRMPISTAAMAALPTTAERGTRMSFGLSPWENPTEYTQTAAGSIDEKSASEVETLDLGVLQQRPPRPL